MLDLSIAKLGVIGIVALIVLGPTRLPHVARTLGTLFGRAQRYLHAVQAEVSQQLELDTLRQIKSNLHTTAQEALHTSRSTLQGEHTPWDALQATSATFRSPSRNRRVRKYPHPYIALMYFTNVRTNVHLHVIGRRQRIHTQAAQAKK
jgi:Tat protein translocase TatB subunit